MMPTRASPTKEIGSKLLSVDPTRTHATILEVKDAESIGDVRLIHDLYGLAEPPLPRSLQPRYNGAPAQDFADLRFDEGGKPRYRPTAMGIGAC